MVFLYSGDEIKYVMTSDVNGELRLEGVADGNYQVVYHYAGTVMATVDISIDGQESYELEKLLLIHPAKPDMAHWRAPSLTKRVSR